MGIRGREKVTAMEKVREKGNVGIAGKRVTGRSSVRMRRGKAKGKGMGSRENGPCTPFAGSKRCRKRPTAKELQRAVAEPRRC